MAHAGPGAESDVYDCLVLTYLSLNRCVTRVCCKSARHWLAAPAQLHTCNRWVWRRSAAVQVITAGIVVAYITHDDRPVSVKPARSEATWRLV